MYAVQHTLFRLCWLLLALVGIGRERRFFFVFTIRIGLLCILVTLVYGRQDDGAHNRPNLARHGARSIERWTKRVRPGRPPLEDEKSGAEVGLDIRPVLDPFLSFSQAEECFDICIARPIHALEVPPVFAPPSLGHLVDVDWHVGGESAGFGIPGIRGREAEC